MNDFNDILKDEMDLDSQIEMIQRCPECDSPLVEKREDRGNGLVEYVLYCNSCGYTAIE